MDAAVARQIAHARHAGQRDRLGDPLIAHVERVAAAVPDEARTVAFLHDVLERAGATLDDLRDAGASAVELAALQLLTRAATESFEAHTLRIAHARGPAGRLARTVKLADLDDHLCRRPLPPGAPPYGWARHHIVIGRERYDDELRAAPAPSGRAAAVAGVDAAAASV